MNKEYYIKMLLARQLEIQQRLSNRIEEILRDKSDYVDNVKKAIDDFKTVADDMERVINR